MRYLSVCSGIEAASVAWHPLGWRPVAFSEIEKFPSAVLAHRWPGVPNLGDMNNFEAWPDVEIDLLVGGTPCQSFSVAGLRGGMDDERGNLALTFCRIAQRYRPRWLVWENVPGVLSSNDGRDFGAFLGALGQLRYGWAYRVLDAQHFGVPQRRRRVFVVACLGDWASAAAVLFDRSSMRGDIAPRRSEAKNVAGTLAGGARGPGGYSTDYIPLVASTLLARRNDSGQAEKATFIVHGTQDPCVETDNAFALGRNNGQENAVCFVQNSRSEVRLVGGDGQLSGALTAQPGAQGQHYVATAYRIHSHYSTAMVGNGTARVADPVDVVRTLDTNGGYAASQGGNVVHAATGVRRLTPLECERLQGFPDDYTRLPHWAGWRNMGSDETPESCAEQGLQVRQSKKSGRWRVKDVDGPRYKATGNSMPVPVMHWIGWRMAIVDALRPPSAEAAA